LNSGASVPETPSKECFVGCFNPIVAFFTGGASAYFDGKYLPRNRHRVFEITQGGKCRAEDFMESQVLSRAGVWYWYGLVLFVLFIAVAGAAAKDVRLARAAAKATAA
jgi:hypothetical protein